MQKFPQVRNALLIAIAGSVLAGCGSDGTSKSSSNRVAGTDYQPVTKTQQPPLKIDQHNTHAVASSTLKSILLSDASSNALDQAVYATHEQSASVPAGEIATGIVLNVRPIACIYGGTFTIGLSIKNGNGDYQLDFNEPMNMQFTTEFDACDQGANKLTGSLMVDFTALIDDLANSQGYDFEAVLNINNLSVEQQGFYPFTFDGKMSYEVSTEDGNWVTTRITADHTLYTADISYQFTEFESIKLVNQSTAEYQYSIFGELADDYLPDSRIRYHTLEPLTGQGFTLPSGGQVAVEGINETLFIDVLNDHDILLSLDLDNNGIIDHQSQSTWQELVLDDLQGGSYRSH